jgi:hypothetical protein
VAGYGGAVGAEEGEAELSWGGREGEGEMEASFLCCATHERVRTLPHGVVATRGVRSPLHHHLRCSARVGWRPVQSVKRSLWLTSGPQLHFKISKIFNLPNIEIPNGDLLSIQNLPNFV